MRMHVHICDRCGGEHRTKTEKKPDKWIDSDLFDDGVVFLLCGQCVANLGRWFDMLKKGTRGARKRGVGLTRKRRAKKR